MHCLQKAIQSALANQQALAKALPIRGSHSSSVLAIMRPQCFQMSRLAFPASSAMQYSTHCRQNFSPECEAAINKQINMELSAFYAYQALAAHFDRDDVALRGFAHFFQKSADEEKEHAEKLIKFQNQRGGRVQLFSIDVPQKTEVQSGLEAMEVALHLEKVVNQALLDLHSIADQHKDPQTMDFLEGEFLEEQLEAIKKLSDYITNLQRCGPGLGEYMFDNHTLEKHD